MNGPFLPSVGPYRIRKEAQWALDRFIFHWTEFSLSLTTIAPQRVPHRTIALADDTAFGKVRQTDRRTDIPADIHNEIDRVVEKEGGYHREYLVTAVDAVG